MPPKTALVLDDNIVLRELMTAVLEEKHFAVTSFADPARYLNSRSKDQCANRCPCFDIILTDNQMPGMTGLELLELFRRKGCRIPVHRTAVISGNWTHKDLDRARQLGCRVFHKPCPIDKIHEWLDEAREFDA